MRVVLPECGRSLDPGPVAGSGQGWARAGSGFRVENGYAGARPGVAGSGATGSHREGEAEPAGDKGPSAGNPTLCRGSQEGV